MGGWLSSIRVNRSMTCIGQLYTWVNYWGEHSEHHTSEIDTCLSVYIL